MFTDSRQLSRIRILFVSPDGWGWPRIKNQRKWNGICVRWFRRNALRTFVIESCSLGEMSVGQESRSVGTVRWQIFVRPERHNATKQRENPAVQTKERPFFTWILYDFLKKELTNTRRCAILVLVYLQEKAVIRWEYLVNYLALTVRESLHVLNRLSKKFWHWTKNIQLYQMQN